MSGCRAVRSGSAVAAGPSEKGSGLPRSSSATSAVSAGIASRSGSALQREPRHAVASRGLAQARQAVAREHHETLARVHREAVRAARRGRVPEYPSIQGRSGPGTSAGPAARCARSPPRAARPDPARRARAALGANFACAGVDMASPRSAGFQHTPECCGQGIGAAFSRGRMRASEPPGATLGHTAPGYRPPSRSLASEMDRETAVLPEELT